MSGFKTPNTFVIIFFVMIVCVVATWLVPGAEPQSWQLFSALFVETNPIPIKTAMKLTGMDSGIMRLPLTELAPENIGVLTSAMRSAGINI